MGRLRRRGYSEIESEIREREEVGRNNVLDDRQRRFPGEMPRSAVSTDRSGEREPPVRRHVSITSIRIHFSDLSSSMILGIARIEIRDTVRKSKPVEGRKKSRIQGTRSDTERRKNGGRGGTTATPVSRNRVPTSSRPRYRTFTRPRANEQDEEGGGRVDRRSYDSSSEDEEKQGREEEEENSERGNAVNAANKRERSRDGKKSSRGAKNRSSKNRRKQVRRKEEGDNGLDSKESLSNKLTTPEPPTTPDPGTGRYLKFSFYKYKKYIVLQI